MCRDVSVPEHAGEAGGSGHEEAGGGEVAARARPAGETRHGSLRESQTQLKERWWASNARPLHVSGEAAHGGDWWSPYTGQSP